MKVIDEKIELKVLNLSKSLPQAHAYALLLKELMGTRQLPVIIGPSEAQAIAFALKGITPPRPFTHDLFVNAFDACRIDLTEVLIYKVVEGVFYSYLYFDKEGEIIRIDSRTSDAVALAMRFGCPIYTTKEILDEESMQWDDGGPISVPITTVNMTMLKEALAKAVHDENYELASQIRDEMRRREQGDLNPDDNILNL